MPSAEWFGTGRESHLLSRPINRSTMRSTKSSRCCWRPKRNGKKTCRQRSTKLDNCYGRASSRTSKKCSGRRSETQTIGTVSTGDQAARLLAAGIAIENGERDIRRRNGKEVDDPKVENALLELHQLLRLPRGQSHFDSPRDLDSKKIKDSHGGTGWISLRAPAPSRKGGEGESMRQFGKGASNFS